MTCEPCCDWQKGKKEQPSAAIFDGCTVQSTPESGERAGYDGHKRKKGSKIHIAVDTLGLLLAAHVTPANEQERAQVKKLAEEVQEVTQNSVEVAFVDQGYTGDDPKNEAKEAGIELIVVKLPEAKKGFVLLPRWNLNFDNNLITPSSILGDRRCNASAKCTD